MQLASWWIVWFSVFHHNSIPLQLRQEVGLLLQETDEEGWVRWQHNRQVEWKGVRPYSKADKVIKECVKLNQEKLLEIKVTVKRYTGKRRSWNKLRRNWILLTSKTLWRITVIKWNNIKQNEISLVVNFITTKMSFRKIHCQHGRWCHISSRW